MMTLYHSNKNQNDPNANRFAALINEAKNVLLGKEISPVLLRDLNLVSELVNRSVSEEKVLS